MGRLARAVERNRLRNSNSPVDITDTRARTPPRVRIHVDREVVNRPSTPYRRSSKRQSSSRGSGPLMEVQGNKKPLHSRPHVNQSTSTSKFSSNVNHPHGLTRQGRYEKESPPISKTSRLNVQKPTRQVSASRGLTSTSVRNPKLYKVENRYPLTGYPDINLMRDDLDLAYELTNDINRFVLFNYFPQKLKETEKLISEKFKENNDVSITSVAASLKCPLTVKQVCKPMRFEACTHIETFSGIPFLKHSHTIGYDFKKREPDDLYCELSRRERKRREDLTFRLDVNDKPTTMYLTCPICGLKGQTLFDLIYCKWTESVLKMLPAADKIWLNKEGEFALTKNDLQRGGNTDLEKLSVEENMYLESNSGFHEMKVQTDREGKVTIVL